MILLSELLQRSGVQPDAVHGDASLGALVADSRKSVPGALFVCMPSTSSDSHAFLAPARAAGASAALVHSAEGFDAAKALGLAVVRVDLPGFVEALWRIARAFHEDPTRALTVVGITGTNGKTTTACILREALEAMGRPTAYLGTLGITTPLHARALENTTPFSVELHALILEAVGDGAEALVMEVSSHALDERRADGVAFDVGVFTNLSQDHLDFHGSMDAYAAAKRRLFDALPKQTDKPFVAAFNVDDPVGAHWSREFAGRQVSYGLAAGALRGVARDVRVDGLTLDLEYGDDSATLNARLGGHFNVSNCLSSAAALVALGFGLDEACEALGHAAPVPGRFEAVPNTLGIGVLVDYAHPPDALEKLLESARALQPRRLITVFGCGGDRDRSKRPLMAKAASERSDVVVLTSDNPRTEDPLSILEDVRAGVVPGVERYEIPDRPEAVAHAIALAYQGDIVVIAGKGHEDYQIIGRTKHPMDDRALARAGLEARR